MLVKIFHYTLLTGLLVIFTVTTNYANPNNFLDSLRIKNNKPNSVIILVKNKKTDTLNTSIVKNDNLMYLENVFNPTILPNARSLYLENISFPDLLYQKYNYLESNKLDSYKKNLSRSLVFDYNKITKYNLGTIGNYLGMAKDISALVLGALS